jgi:predicted benzoate:H+ symporter BenE
MTLRDLHIRKSEESDEKPVAGPRDDFPAPASGTANRYDRMEWAGAFGDLGTLIPFVVGYIAVLKMDPVGVLLAFGITKVAVGLFYRTPMPVQPMKAIGGAAIGQAGAITPAMVYGSGLVTAVIWLILGLTGTVDRLAKLAAKPVVRGIVLGLGFTFVLEAFRMMSSDPLVAGGGLVATYLLLSNHKVPAMFVLLLLGTVVAVVQQPDLPQKLVQAGVGFHLPSFALGSLTWQDILWGGVILAIPQIPLTLGNACIAVVAENNSLFADRPVTERKVATSMGLMNLFSPLLGGVPMCHGAGGMAGHVRFGARTGGALVILGGVIIALALLFGNSVELIFRMFPSAILGVILFFAGLELALSSRDIGSKKEDIYVMLATAGFATWNMGAAFVVGVLLHQSIKRGIVKL